MTPLSDLIESRELQVECRHCGWNGLRALSWLSVNRDMNCPACEGVIVLNTSARRQEIAALRRQVSALHEQLSDTISAANGIMSRVQQPLRSLPPPKQRLELTLLHEYRNNKWPSLGDSSGSRRLQRARR